MSSSVPPQDDQSGGCPFRRVIAIVRPDLLAKVERRLQDLGVAGVSISKVKGFGEYVNLFRADWLDEHNRIEVFLPRERAHEIARAIVAAARTGVPGDGIVVVLPVEAAYRIRTGELATPAEFGDRRCRPSGEAS